MKPDDYSPPDAALRQKYEAARELGLMDRLLEETPLTLRCDCSRARIEQVLLSMGEGELRSLIEEQGGAEVSCHFCRSQYRFDAGELEALIEEGRRRG